MTAVVLGAGGQLGRALTGLLPGAAALTRADLDVDDRDAVAAFDWDGVDVIYNAAAYTAVDAAETPDGRAAAWRTNAVAVASLAAAAAGCGATLVHVSTEYVLPGTGSTPQPEDTPLAPLGAYGAAKAAGELAAARAPRHYVVRTSWVVGEGGNFVRTMLRLAARGIAPAVVDDQVGRPTFASDLACGLVSLAGSGSPYGTYHLTNTGPAVSWAGLAATVFELAGHDPTLVTRTSTADYFADKPGAARRPSNSLLALDKATAAGVALPPWPESLAEYVRAELHGTATGPVASRGGGTPTGRVH